MQKPFGYDDAETKEFGNFKSIPAGPYVCGIRTAVEGKTKELANKITLTIDIAKGEYKNYYRELSDKMGTPCYPEFHQGTELKSLPYFKGLIKAIEESNPGYKFNFDEKTLVRKFVGVMMQEVFYINKKGEKKSILKPSFFCSVATAESGTLTIPKPKDETGNSSYQQSNSLAGFIDDHDCNQNPPSSAFAEEDLPF